MASQKLIDMKEAKQDVQDRRKCHITTTTHMTTLVEDPYTHTSHTHIKMFTITYMKINPKT